MAKTKYKKIFVIGSNSFSAGSLIYFLKRAIKPINIPNPGIIQPRKRMANIFRKFCNLSHTLRVSMQTAKINIAKIDK